jgi:hypothetical protein
MITLDLERGRIRLRSARPISGLKAEIPGAFWAKGRKPEDAHWSIPLSMPVCRRLRERFGAELEIAPTLWAWAKEEQAKARAMAALASARDTDLTRLPGIAPRLAKAMQSRTYQRVGARFISEGRANGAGVLIADQPGLGKTLEALGGIAESGIQGPYLVVTPKTSVNPVWAREIPRWLDGQTVVTLPEGDRTRNKITAKQRERRDAALDAMRAQPSLASTWVIVHPEAVRTRVWWVCGECPQETPRKAGKVELKCGHEADLRKRDRVEHEYPQLFGLQWGAVICDESDRALLRLSGTPTQTRQGMEMLALRPDGMKVAMTGTPVRGRPHLLWGQLNWLDPKAFPSFWNWMELFWEITSNGYSSHVIGALRDEAGLWASLDRYVLRRTKAEVAPDMPAKTYVGTPAIPTDEGSPIAVWLEMEGAQAQAYLEMMTTSAANLEDGSRVEAIGILAELTRLKQFAGASGKMVERLETCKREECQEPKPHKHPALHFQPSLPSNKFEYLVQLLDELGFPDEPTTKVVIVSQFTEMLNLFARELPARLQALSAHPKTPLKATMTPVLLTGEQTGAARERAIAGMNEPVGRGAHLMFLQTKTGGVAITLDQADVMVFLDETWVPDDQEQAEDRIHRVSNPRPVWYHYLKSLDTIDLGIALTNAERDDSSKRLLDGRRGVEYARAVIRRSREMSGGVGPSSGGNAPDRSSDVQPGGSGGARKARAMDGDPGTANSNKAQARRNRSEKTSDTTLAPETNVGYKGTTTGRKTNPPKERKTMAEPKSDEQILAYKDKAPSPVAVRMADWMIEKLGLEFKTPKDEALYRATVGLTVALRMIFQASPENQGVRAEAKDAREEAATAKATAKATKKTKAAAAADEAEEEAPAPKPKAAKATKAAKAAPKSAPKDEEDDEDTTVAAPAKKSAPKKAARTGAAAPF